MLWCRHEDACSVFFPVTRGYSELPVSVQQFWDSSTIAWTLFTGSSEPLSTTRSGLTEKGRSSERPFSQIRFLSGCR